MNTRSREGLLNEWMKDRPAVIKELAKKYPPWKEYELKGHEGLGTYVPLAYSEDGTIRCLKTDWLGFQIEVFGMEPKTLVPVTTKSKKGDV